MKNFILSLFAFLCAAAAHAAPPITTVSPFDITKYVGTWYEIGSVPQWFQKGCVCTRATYSPRDDGRIDVLNECNKETIDGKLSVAKGVARFQGPTNEARLEVKFFLWFWGDYWVTELGEDYSVVTNQKGTSLWVLSRTPTMPAERLQEILERTRAKGIEVETFRETLQVGCAGRG